MIHNDKKNVIREGLKKCGWIERTLIAVAIVLLVTSYNVAYAGARLTVELEGGYTKVWEFEEMQDARDFMREECPPQVTKVIIEKTCILGLDDKC